MADAFISQFGDTLFNPSGDGTTSPSVALSGKDHVMLYFSAHWCPPCRRFTPSLIELYKKLKNSKNMELVFCSLDREEEAYKEYTSDMPWLCMPFKAKETTAMASKYKASGIPHLVIVDDATGEIITTDGVEEASGDEEGQNFPWKPKSFAEVWPTKILSSKDSKDEFLDSSTLKDKHLMLYFSAHWCPPCRAFTPKLSEAYKSMKGERSDFELVFVSSDRTEESFNEYFETMSFCALPFEHREAKKSLSNFFDVSGIPKLIMLGPESETGGRPLINGNVRSYIESGDFSEFPFHKKNYGSVEDNAGDINDVKSLVIFNEYGDDEDQDKVKEVSKKVAESLKEMKDLKDTNILWALSPDGLAKKIRSITDLPDMSEDPTMIILDIPDSAGYYKTDVTEITEENVINFLKAPGKRLQL
mmetsp:Transcript_25596/g.31519  ORF Transcript_25596/g.31519 Transcript_25596/m.31519 type:complete len:417 (-) Transcript_25596:230-1480(-)